MEKKTKNRLLGITIIASLVIIFLPLFQSNEHVKSTTIAQDKPPFPQQVASSAQVTINPIQTIIKNGDAAQVNLDDQASNATTNQPKQILIKPISQADIINQPEIHDHENTKNQTKQKSNPISNKVHNSQLKKTQNNLDHLMVIHPLTQTAKNNLEPLVDIQSPAWVVQIASYHEKSNAIRMVNQLREHNFHAFIQHYTTKNVSYTRVYIGPEKSLEKAHKLAQKLNQSMHITGLVIPYKPMSL